jgi:hypothetical protein
LAISGALLSAEIYMRKLIISLLLATTLSFGAPLTFTTLAGWQAAGPQTAGSVTFDAISSGQYSSILALSGFDFWGIGGNLIVYNPVASFMDLGTGVSLAGPIGPSAIQINLPSAVFGVGFLVGSWGGGAINAIINGDTGNPYAIPSPTLPPGPGAFWGIRNDVAISTVTIVGVDGTRAVIDSLVWGGEGVVEPPPPSEIPETTSALLIGTGLLMLPLIRRAVTRR